MSIWGKLGGAAAGLVRSGGALRSALGGLFSASPENLFTIAMIGLSAKMAKADGIVTEDEVRTFERLFRVAPEEAANVRRVFNMARGDTAGY